MRKFTDTEIDLCKKIAEKERKEIGKGDLYLWEEDVVLHTGSGFYNVNPQEQPVFELIPLWQEHDCLEWLREHKWRILDVYCGLKKPKDGWNVVIIPWDGKCSDNKDVKEFEGKTLLECLQRHVLAVMEKNE